MEQRGKQMKRQTRGQWSVWQLGQSMGFGVGNGLGFTMGGAVMGLGFKGSWVALGGGPPPSLGEWSREL